MKKYGSMSPILRRLKEKGPNKYCLVKTRTINKEDIEDYPRWGVIKDWYEQLENHDDCDSIHMIVQSIVNAVVYQERIYFALTRDIVVNLFKNDKNWKKKKPSMSNASYKDLLNTMVESGWFEPHPENDRFFKQKKPRIFKVISEDVLDLMKPVPAEEQLRQVLDFVENDFKDEVSDEVSDVVLVEEEVEDLDLESEKNEKTNNSNLNTKPNEAVEFEDVLIKYRNEKMTLEIIPSLVADAIKNCNDFGDNKQTSRAFERFLEDIGLSATKKSSNFLEKLVKKFESESRLQIQAIKTAEKDIEWQKPELPAIAKIVKTTVDMDEEAENYTLKVLNSSFGKENIKILKRQLEKADDEQRQLEIKAEIEFWESVV
jgi:hypothetical protein